MAWRIRAAGAAIGAVAIAAAGLGSALAAESVDEISDEFTAITVLGINDFHGRIGGSAGMNFACTVSKEKAAGDYIFTSAGDNIGATPFISSSQQDIPTIEFLNALGLEATAVGNHEFDRGFDWLTNEGIPRSSFEHLGANVYFAGTTTPALPEYFIKDIDGIRVGVVGVVTEDTPTLVVPAGVASLDFGDPVEAVNRVATQLTEGDLADVIIAQYHEGSTEGSSSSTLEEQVAAGGIFARIVEETSPEVDAIFTGHTHLTYAWDGPTTDGTRPVVQTGSYGENLGRVQLGIDTETLTVVEYSSSLVTTSPPASDPDLTPEENQEILDEWWAPCLEDDAFLAAQAIADAAQVEADVIGQEVIGSVTDDITTAHLGGERDDRLRESTLGNLTANVWLSAMNWDGRPGADIGIMNSGGLRDELIYDEDMGGDITYADAVNVHPFANTMQVIDITGAQVVTLLEQQWQPAGAPRPFLKLGLSDNVRYTYDPDAATGERITGVWVDEAPIDPDATYTIASGVFLIGGGDNFTVLREGTNLRDTGVIDTDVFIEYFERYSPVSPSFEKNGVAVSGVTLPVEAEAGETVSFTVSDTDLTSLGAPDNTSFTILLGEGDDAVEVGTATIAPTEIDGLPAQKGLSEVSFTIPEDFGAAEPAGVSLFAAAPLDTVITLVAEPSGTVVRLQALITPGEVSPTDPPTQTPTETPTETPEPTQTSTPTPTSTGTPAPPRGGSLASTGADIAPYAAAIALLLLLGSGLVVATRRRRSQH